MIDILFNGFDWDDGNIIKIQKHGLDCKLVEDFFHGKIRIGKKGEGRLIRPISARLMHEKEIKKYEEEITKIQNG
jgi:uncharacterized DUF497 family protein